MLYAEEILNTLSEWLPSDVWPNPMYIFESESQSVVFGTSVFEYQLRTHTRPNAIAVIAFGNAQHIDTGEVHHSVTVYVITHDREEAITLLDTGERVSAPKAGGRIPALMRLALGIPT